MRASRCLLGYPRQPAGVRGVPEGRAREVARSGSSCSATSSAMAPIRNGSVDTVMELVAQGAIAVRGNHDQAVNATTESHECGGADRDRMDARPARRRAAAVPRRTADAGGGRRAPLRPLGSLEPAALALCPIDGGCRQEPDRDAGPCHLLRPHPSPGALFDVGDGEDDELRARRPTFPCRCCAGGNGLPCSARSASRATAIHPRLSCCSTRYRARSPIAARPMTSRRRREPHSRERPAALARRPAVAGALEADAEIPGQARRRDRRLHHRRAACMPAAWRRCGPSPIPASTCRC